MKMKPQPVARAVIRTLTTANSEFAKAMAFDRMKASYEKDNPSDPNFASWAAKQSGLRRAAIALLVEQAQDLGKLDRSVTRVVLGSWLANQLRVVVRIARLCDPKVQKDLVRRFLDAPGKARKELRDHETKLGIAPADRKRAGAPAPRATLTKTDAGHEARVVFRGRDLVISISAALDLVELRDGSSPRSSSCSTTPMKGPLDHVGSATAGQDPRNATEPPEISGRARATRFELLDHLRQLGFGLPSLKEFHRVLLGTECTDAEHEVYEACQAGECVVPGLEGFRAAAVATLWKTSGIRPAYLVVPEQSLTSAYLQLEDLAATIARAHRRRTREVEAARAALRQVRLTANVESAPDRWVATGLQADAVPSWAKGRLRGPKAA